jgi:hypothetical protein
VRAGPILGLFDETAGRLRGQEREQALTLWQRRGRKVFAEVNADQLR